MDWIGWGRRGRKEGGGEVETQLTEERREREILSKQGGEKEDEEQSDLLYFLFSF
jgi:hypothetical protein